MKRQEKMYTMTGTNCVKHEHEDSEEKPTRTDEPRDMPPPHKRKNMRNEAPSPTLAEQRGKEKIHKNQKERKGNKQATPGQGGKRDAGQT